MGLLVNIMYSELRTRSDDWDRIYGDSPKENILLSKPVRYYIDAVDEILEDDKERLLCFFPHILAIKELNSIYKIKNILEIGCGSGIYSYVLYKYFGDMFMYYLLDFSKNSISDSRNLFGLKDNIVLLRADAFNIPIKDNSVDVCITGGLIEHFDLNSQMSLLAEISRVSRMQVHQYPVDNAFYWVQRFIVSQFNNGKWPFGYEVPINEAKERQLFGKIVKYRYSYVFKRLEFKLFVNKWYKSYKFVELFNKLGIYKLIYADKVVYECLQQKS